MKKFRYANVLDSEQTCYPDDKFPVGEVREFIELGLCKLDLHTLEIGKAISIPIVPRSSQVSEYCTQLTGWTMARLRTEGIPFDKACRRIVSKHGGHSQLLVVDSAAELTRMRAQCERLSLPYPYGDHTLNVSTLFTLLTGQTRNLSLEKKLAYVGLKYEGRLHSAADDATNIARLLVKLLATARTLFPQARLLQAGLELPADENPA